ncbi:hypothetical protein D3C71_1223090 [compost metagenome]
MDVPAQDQVDARLRPRRQRAFAPIQQVGQVGLYLGANGVMRDHDAQLARPGLAQALRDPGDLRVRDLAVFMAARPRGVHAYRQQPWAFEHGFQHRAQRAPVVAVWVQRAGEHVVQRDVMVARHGQHGQRQALDEPTCRGELRPPRALRDVTAKHHQIGL